MRPGLTLEAIKRLTWTNCEKAWIQKIHQKIHLTSSLMLQVRPLVCLKKVSGAQLSAHVQNLLGAQLRAHFQGESGAQLSAHEKKSCAQLSAQEKKSRSTQLSQKLALKTALIDNLSCEIFLPGKKLVVSILLKKEFYERQLHQNIT